MTMTGRYIACARARGESAGFGTGGCRPAAPSAYGAAIGAELRSSWLSPSTPSTAALSSTSLAALPSFSMLERSMTTGPVTSMTTRALPGAERPPRKNLTSPTGVPLGSAGNCSLTSGRSTNTRLGLVKANTWKSTARSRPIIKRVRFLFGLEAAASSTSAPAATTCWASQATDRAIGSSASNARRNARRHLPETMPLTPVKRHQLCGTACGLTVEDGIFRVTTAEVMSLESLRNGLHRTNRRAFHGKILAWEQVRAAVKQAQGAPTAKGRTEGSALVAPQRSPHQAF